MDLQIPLKICIFSEEDPEMNSFEQVFQIEIG